MGYTDSKNQIKTKNRERKYLNKSKKSNKHTDDKRKGKNPDNYRCRIDKLNKIDSSMFPSGFKTKILHENPYIVKIRRLLNTEEIETLLSMAEGKFTRSTIVVDGEMTYSNTRTSETAFITENGHYETYSEPVERLLEKICYLMECRREQIEGLMVVKYGYGEEYYNHHDYFKPEHTDVLEDGGQRIATFFCYLSSLDENEGGETEFPLLKIKSKPSKGTAVFWWDVDSNNNLLNKTLHRGNPVNSKDRIKYGLNIWIREYGW